MISRAWRIVFSEELLPESVLPQFAHACPAVNNFPVAEVSDLQ
jgi:hypothetical protein